MKNASNIQPQTEKQWERFDKPQTYSSGRLFHTQRQSQGYRNSQLHTSLELSSSTKEDGSKIATLSAWDVTDLGLRPWDNGQRSMRRAQSMFSVPDIHRIENVRVRGLSQSTTRDGFIEPISVGEEEVREVFWLENDSFLVTMADDINSELTSVFKPPL